MRSLKSLSIQFAALHHCQSQDVGFKIVNRQPQLCTTNRGDLCVFPFTYQGVRCLLLAQTKTTFQDIGCRYEKCTNANSAAPWCATVTNTDGVVITNKLVIDYNIKSFEA